MARAYSATFPFLAPQATTTSSIVRRLRLNRVLASSVTIPFPSKRTNRKNHLRPKILKTLTKPFPSGPLPEVVPVELNVPNPIPFLPENDAVFDAASGENILPEVSVSESFSTAAEQSGFVGKFSAKSILKFGGYFVGVFLFQVIVSVFVLGNTNSNDKEDKLSSLDNKESILMNGSNVQYLDETELEDRISEIRAMARNAREKEKEKTEREEGDDESGIEKEIGARLSKLDKRHNSKREQLFMNYLSLFGIEEDESEPIEDGLKSKEDEKLMFKKKYRFRSSSVNSRNSLKGFSGSSSRSISSLNGGLRHYEQLNSSRIDEKKLEKQMEESQKEIQSGAVQGTSEGRLSSEGTDSSKSGDLEKQNSQSLRKENQRTTTIFDGPASSSINGSTDNGKRQVANKLGYKQSDVQTNLWWLKLPYVLAILVRRGSEHEAAGLYMLRTVFADDEGDSCYTVAFEDRGDANNFCYLLDSYFEDLGDFSADIVPMSVKEIHEAVKSKSKKVIVVKKGQLKLYAGQPFAEVEMALHALLE